MPTYYVAVDSRVMREFSQEINTKYTSVTKFLPTPNLDKWRGENIYRFYHRPGPLWPRAEVPLTAGLMSDTGITYVVVMNVMMQLAFFMGFDPILMTGIDHSLPSKMHFWGHDGEMGNGPNNDDIAESYRILREGFAPRKVINISTYSELDEKYVPRDNWGNWV